MLFGTPDRDVRVTQVLFQTGTFDQPLLIKFL